MLKHAIVAILLFMAPLMSSAENVASLRVPSGHGSLNLALLHVPPSTSRRALPVLILHGATFPSGNAAAWKIQGKSWMDDLAAHGHDVYALDFLGYGQSDKYPEMAADDPSGPALGNLSSMVSQVDRAMAAISARHPDAAVHLIAHSVGTLVAAGYAELHSSRVARLVLFGAPVPPPSRSSGEVRRVRYVDVTADDQLNAFEPRVRDSGYLDPQMFSAWVATYLATDAKSATRQPASVRVPAGMGAALGELKRSGKLPYDPARITTPTLIVQGEWDALTSPSQGLWLFEQLASPIKRLVVLSRGGHRLHLEQNRWQLYQEVRTFLQEER